MTPILRSDQTRHFNNSFDDGWRDDTLGRAAMIRAFPRNAATDIRMFNVKINVFSSSTTPLQQKDSAKVVSFPSFVKLAMITDNFIDL